MILRVNFIKLFSYFFALPSSVPVSLWSTISENVFFFLDLLVQKLFFDKNNWFLLLIVVDLSHIICLLFAKKLASQKQAIAFDKNFIAISYQGT